MTRAASVVGFGATGTVLAAGGAYMMGAFDSFDNLDIPLSLEDGLKKNPKIVSNYFPNLSFENEGDEWADNKPPSNFLGNADDGRRSRLVVNWEKYKITSGDNANKWSGNIRWLWTFLNNDKGLLVFVSAKASSEDSKLDVEGAVYTLSYEAKAQSGNKEWKIKNNKKIANNTKIDDADNKFPLTGDTFKSNLKVKDYWGFLDGTKKLTDLCKKETADEGKADSIEKFKGAWTWKKGEDGANHKPLEWSKDDHKWINSLFSTPQPALKDLFTNLTGTWKEEKLISRDLAVNATS